MRQVAPVFLALSALLASLAGCLEPPTDDNPGTGAKPDYPDGFLLGDLSCDDYCIGVPFINETIAEQGLLVGDYRIHTQWMKTGQTGLGFSILGLISYHGTGVGRLFSIEATAYAPDGTELGNDQSFCVGPVADRFGDCHEFLRKGQIMPFSIVIDDISEIEAPYVHSLSWSVSPAGVYSEPKFAKNIAYTFDYGSRSDLALNLSNQAYQTREFALSYYGLDGDWNIVCMDLVKTYVEPQSTKAVRLVGKDGYRETSCPRGAVYGIDIWND